MGISSSGVNLNNLFGSLVLAAFILMAVFSLVMRSWSAQNLLRAEPVQAQLTEARVVQAMEAASNVLTYPQYMEKVYHTRLTATSQDIWDSLSAQQRDMLSCTNFNPSDELRNIAEADYEPGPVKYDSTYTNPCWWELMEDKTPYVPEAYLNHGRVEDYIKNMRRHWKKAKRDNQKERLRCVPYVYVVGTGKCGSTDLYSLLKTHPEIQSGPLKEPRWWIRTRFGLGKDSSMWAPFRAYVDLYDGAASQIVKNGNHNNVIVDASVGTMYITQYWMLYPGNEGVSQPRVINAHHLRALVPHAKIVILIREPVKRLYSHYKEDWEEGATPEDFHRKVSRAVQKMQTCLLTRTLRECVYDPCVNGVSKDRRIKLRASIYYIFIKDWLAVFPKEQVRIYTLEDYQSSRLKVANDLTQFLGVGKFRGHHSMLFEERDPIRASSGKPMLPETQTLLQAFFKPFTKKLQLFLREQTFNVSIPYL